MTDKTDLGLTVREFERIKALKKQQNKKLMKEEKQTELLKFTVNPDFLELMQVPNIYISSSISFDMIRHGKKLHCTIYTGKEGTVINAITHWMPFPESPKQ